MNLAKLVPALFLLSAAASASTTTLICTPQKGGHTIALEYASGHRKVEISFLSSSGAQEQTGSLKCSGPQQSAFSCTGQAEEGDGTPSFEVDLVVPETTFQSKDGAVFLFWGDDRQDFVCLQQRNAG